MDDLPHPCANQMTVKGAFSDAVDITCIINHTCYSKTGPGGRGWTVVMIRYHMYQESCGEQDTIVVPLNPPLPREEAYIYMYTAGV